MSPLPSSWPFRADDIHAAPTATEVSSMSAVDSKVAGKPYNNNAPGRKSRDGSEAVIKLETLQTRMNDLVALKIKSGQAAAEYTMAIKAVAEATGLLSVTVNKIVRAKAGNSFVEDKVKAQQLALVFEECGEFDEPHSSDAARAAPDKSADESQLPLDNSPVSNPVQAAADGKGGRRRRGNGAVAAPE